jgi:TfoX/Sxy family transcriptional regulator of competence genes
MPPSQNPSQAFADYLVEQLNELEGVSTKRFFSGTALVIGEVQLGFVSSDETLYLRLDPADRAELEALGGEPFSYGRSSGKTTVTPGYFSIPADLVDDRAALNDWATRAYIYARSVHKPKRKRS